MLRSKIILITRKSIRHAQYPNRSRSSPFHLYPLQTKNVVTAAGSSVLTSNFRHSQIQAAQDVYQNIGARYIRKCLRDVIRTRKLVPPLGVMRALLLIYRSDVARLHNDILATCVTDTSSQAIAPRTVVKILEKKFAIACRRSVYLECIQKYRQLGYPIVYIDEAWFAYSLDSCQGHHQSLDRTERTKKASDQTLVILAGGDMGFMPGTLMTKSVTKSRRTNTQSGNCRNKSGIDAKVFCQYMSQQLLPSIPKNSVIVMDNASFHRRALKQHSHFSLIEVLDSDRHLCYTSRSSSSVSSGITHSKDQSIDDDITSFRSSQGQGHVYLPLPAYHTTLNPMELTWADLRLMLQHHGSCRSVKSGGNRLCLSGEDLETYIKSKLDLIDESRWKFYMDKVVAKERSFREADMLW